VKQEQRDPFDQALRRARESAYPPGEFVGQESFMRASEILALARRAGVGPGVRVLDLCCGVAGPGRLVTAELGCTYLGVDASSSAVDIACERAAAAGLTCRFEVATVPPVPEGPFDVVMLLETMLAFPDKEVVLDAIVAALEPRGRLAFTLEEGTPLTTAEAARMPDADTVWLTPLPEIVELMKHRGLAVLWSEECSRSHRDVVDAMILALTADRHAIAAQVGTQALDELLAAHVLWSDWLGAGRVRKFAVVAEKVG
jgi:cyclopropane fatty-acyl-phospholipid synthase-like methyltransferase